MVLFYIPVSAAILSGRPVLAQAPSVWQVAEAGYRDRANPGSAQKALDVLANELDAQPKSFEAGWRLARICYWIGRHGPESQRRSVLIKGVDAGRKAAAVEPLRPEGHFWLAANMGALAESYGLSQGLKYRGTIKSELEKVLRIDPAFMTGSADRALGRWYFKVPRLFGGSNKHAEEHLRTALTYDEHSTITRVFLAEVLIDEHRTDEARAELQRVIDAPINPEWAPEDEDFKRQARTLLQTLRNR